MNLKILMGILIYWTLVFLVFGTSFVGLDALGNPFQDDGYTTSGEFNSSGFSSDEEIDSDTGGFWGFFSGIAGVFVAMGRIIILVLFGFTPVLTGGLQIVFTAWSTLFTIFVIAFVISAFWNG